jgi:hypothetical protein
MPLFAVHPPIVGTNTTELYAHVTTKGVDNIKSPLDQISNQLDLEDKTGISDSPVPERWHPCPQPIRQLTIE